MGNTIETGTLLRRAYQNLNLEFERQLSEYDVTVQQFTILELVSQGVTNTPARIALEMGVDAAAVTRLSERLVKKEVLRRRPCTQDRRVCFLDLTTKGKNLLPKLIASCESLQSQLSAVFSERELNELHKHLDKIYKFHIHKENI